MTASTRLLYLHGFRSSPQSFKALRLQAWLRQRRPDVEWACPQLEVSPAHAIRQAEAALSAWPAGSYAVIGSSLGGFYATCIAERHGCPAVVLNPAIDPARDLAPYVGELQAYHDPRRRLVFEPGHLDELRAMTPPRLQHPQLYLAIVAKGDELLDWREMCARYAGARIRLLEGSDHALSDFDDHLPHILRFLGLVA